MIDVIKPEHVVSVELWDGWLAEPEAEAEGKPAVEHGGVTVDVDIDVVVVVIVKI